MPDLFKNQRDAARSKRHRSEKVLADRCINEPNSGRHGPPVRGSRCAACWLVKGTMSRDELDMLCGGIGVSLAGDIWAALERLITSLRNAAIRYLVKELRDGQSFSDAVFRASVRSRVGIADRAQPVPRVPRTRSRAAERLVERVRQATARPRRVAVPDDRRSPLRRPEPRAVPRGDRPLTAVSARPVVASRDELVHARKRIAERAARALRGARLKPSVPVVVQHLNQAPAPIVARLPDPIATFTTSGRL